MCLIKEERCSSDGFLIFYGPVNVMELGRELRNSAILHCFLWEPSGWSDTICNNDYGVIIGQVTSSRLCRICTNLRILSEISGVSRNKQNEGNISILGSQKSKKVTKSLHSHQRNLYQFYQNKIL